jgi:hypothetical protein
MPVIIEFSRCIGTYSSAKFELISYNVYSNQFDWKDILVKMVFIALVLIFGEITR